MDSFIPILISFAWAFQVSGTPGREPAATGYTGAPELLETAGRNFAYSGEEYAAFVKNLGGNSTIVPITQRPPNLSADARFGYNLAYGGFNRSWILDGDEKRGYVLYADLNANGNLDDDSSRQFVLERGAYSLVLVTVASETSGGTMAKYPVVMKLVITHATPPGKNAAQLALDIQFTTRRSGELQIDGKKLAFALIGSQGIYDRKYNRVFFDLDGDGKASPVETYNVWERYVDIGDRSYEFEVQRFGERLTLKDAAKHVPPRINLAKNSQLPDISFEDIDGRPRRLAEFRGKVVLLDFWGTWCAPCREEVPKLASLYRQFHERGFEIIGIHYGLDTLSIRSFASTHDMNWTQAMETEDGTLHRLFRVEGWPTYYLIGKEGAIVSADLRPGDELTKEIEQQLK